MGIRTKPKNHVTIGKNLDDLKNPLDLL